jgi:hypothetical protein
MPPVLGWPVLQPVEPPARLCELRVLVPGLPVCARPPRADNYSPVWLIGLPEELSSHPTRSPLRGRQTSAHRSVPFPSCAFLQVYMRNDSHHRVGPPRNTSLILSVFFDHLIRPLQERRRNRQAEEGLGALEVDDQLELGRLLNRQVGGLGAFEDSVHVARRASEKIV